jgi:hypothetical protein
MGDYSLAIERKEPQIHETEVPVNYEALTLCCLDNLISF